MPAHPNHQAENRLNHTDDQHGGIVAAFPESPTQTCDDGTRYEQDEKEAEDVMLISHAAPADRLRRENVRE